MKSLKQEISRVARKEARGMVGPLRRPSVAARSAIADLRRRVAALEKANRSLQADAAKLAAAMPPPEVPAEVRVTARSVRAMRRRLKLSAAEMGALLGVTDQAVYNLEKGTGRRRVRPATSAAFAALRGVGAKEAKQRAEEALKAKAKPRRKTAKRKRGRR